VRLVYFVIGTLIAAIAVAFAFSPIRHGERYLARAAQPDHLSADAATLEPTS
jgi:hypothetical protein